MNRNNSKVISAIRAASCSLAMAVAACSPTQRAAIPPAQDVTEAALSQQSNLTGASRRESLFVVNAWARNFKGALTTYHTPSTRSSQQFNLSAPRSIAAGGGFIYISNYTAQRVWLFQAGSSGQIVLLNTIRVRQPGVVAADSKGSLYVSSGSSDNSGLILFFPVGATKPTRTITAGISAVGALSCDSFGDLFVLNLAGFGPSVAVFTADKNVPQRTITRGIGDNPSAIAVDGAGNLYVGNAGDPTNVVVYARGKRSAQRVIRTGISQPIALAIDKVGDLYVSNQLVPKTTRSSITAYAPGSSTPMLTIDGSGCPYGGDCEVSALAFDSANRLYVPNEPVNEPPSDTGQVSVFLPGQTTAWRTITQGIDGPSALVVSK